MNKSLAVLCLLWPIGEYILPKYNRSPLFVDGTESMWICDHESHRTRMKRNLKHMEHTAGYHQIHSQRRIRYCGETMQGIYAKTHVVPFSITNSCEIFNENEANYICNSVLTI